MPKYVYKYIADDSTIYIKRTGIDESFMPIKGHFFVSKANELFYKINMTSTWRKEYELGTYIKCEGVWKLDNDNKLSFLIKKAQNWQNSSKISFKSTIIDNKSNALVLSAKIADNQFSTITLRGRWSLDSKNRLSFYLLGAADNKKLIFSGKWDINKDNSLVYHLADKQTLKWQGKWSIDKVRKLSYSLTASSESLFEFKVSVESNSLRASDDRIKFRVGASANNSDVFTLYGNWKIYKSGAVEFIIKSRNTKQSLKFIMTKLLAKDSKAIATLALSDKPWLKLELNRKFLDGDAKFKLAFKHLVKTWKIEAKFEFLI